MVESQPADSMHILDHLIDLKYSEDPRRSGYLFVKIWE
jgi:hypothetical protein